MQIFKYVKSVKQLIPFKRYILSLIIHLFDYKLFYFDYLRPYIEEYKNIKTKVNPYLLISFSKNSYSELFQQQ